jgi:cell division septation protein DedD
MNTETATTTETERATSKPKRTKKAKTEKAGANATAKTKKNKPAIRKSKPAASPAGDTKKAIVLALLRRKEGATTAEIAKATDWQNHTIRGFISGTLTKKMGLTVESAKNESRERTYRITA